MVWPNIIIHDCLPSVADPERAELLACRLAASLARDQGVQKLILEMDCSGIVTKLVSSEFDRSVHGCSWTVG
jgi:uncharacterized protein YydD (DUF2326 family)